MGNVLIESVSNGEGLSKFQALYNEEIEKKIAVLMESEKNSITSKMQNVTEAASIVGKGNETIDDEEDIVDGE